MKSVALNRVWAWRLGIVLLTGAGSIYFAGWNFDDAYIVFRFARNLASGTGWAYNPGQPLNASTSPLYTLILAGLSLVINVEAAAHLLFFLCLAGCGLLVHALLRRQGLYATAGPAALIIAGNLFIYRSSGLETTLLWFLVCLSLYWYLHDKFKSAALGAGLVALSRPEGALWGIVLLTDYLFRKRRIPWQGLIIFAIVILPWLIFAQLYFPEGGLRHILTAKIAQGHSGFWGSGPLILKGACGEFLHTSGYFLPLYLLAAGRGIYRWRIHRLPLLLLAWALLHLVTLSFFGLPSYHWYHAPFFLYAVFVVAQGSSPREMPINTVVSSPFNARRHRLQVGLSYLVLLLILIHQGLLLVRERANPMPEAYRQAVQLILKRTPPGAEIMAAEIGVLGYFSNRPMHDFVGLLDARAAGPLKRGETFWWLGVLNPAVVILHEPLWNMEQPIAAHPLFKRDYVMAARVTYPNYFPLLFYVPRGAMEEYWRGHEDR